VQWQTIHHLKLREGLLSNRDAIDTMIQIAQDPSEYAQYLDPNVFKVLMAKVDEKLMAFEHSGMLFVLIFYFQWMYVFQMFYQGIYAGRTKRVMKYF
jgi:hypothetical protein